MPTITRATEALEEIAADAVAVFVACTGAEPDASPVVAGHAGVAGARMGIDLAQELRAVRFTGAAGSVARIPTRGALGAPVLLVVGLGPVGKVNLEALRRAAGAAARQAPRSATLALAVPDDLPAQASPAQRVQAVAEGAGLGAYAYTAYRSKPHDLPALDRILVACNSEAEPSDRALRQADLVVRATCLARDLVNTPPGDKRPPALAERLAGIGRDAGLDVTVHDETALREGGFGGILGVGQGSSAPPRLVELRYEPPGGGDGAAHVILVGKGITFDSGGLSLKPSESMATMKSDMSGAAAVVAVLSALGELGVGLRVTGLAALAENLPSGTAIRVSDVLTQRGGKTVEVMNTDAEGRLVLADALAYGVESAPAAIIDIATLTGAQVVALGNKVSAVLGNDDALVEQLRAAARAAGEQIWPLPLHREYAEQLRSDVADLKNIGKRGQAGTIIGALYLAEFTGEVPWAHLDIAGPAFAEEADDFYTPAGGSGAGVRLLLRYLLDRSAAAADAAGSG